MINNPFNPDPTTWVKPDLPDFTHDVNGKELKIENDFSLRPANVTLELTQEHVIEIFRCSINPLYFIENYCKIVTPDDGVVPFKMRGYQQRLTKHIHDNRFSISMMPRQTGKSTTLGAYATWYMNFNEYKFVAILGHKLSLAEEILQKVTSIYRTIPKWLQCGTVSMGKRKLELENGTRAMVESTGSGSAAGFTINLLILDEFALVANHKANDFISSVFPTVSASKESKICIISTPRGMNHFHTLYTDPNNEFKSFSIPWNEPPGRDAEFKAKTIKNIGQSRWNQEYECKFLGSSNTLIAGEYLQDLFDIPPINIKFDGAMRIYEEPKPGKIYAVTVDPSQGLGGDDTAIHVLDITEYPIRQVLAYNSDKIRTLALDSFLKELGELYNNAIIIIENNAMGLDVAERLYMELEYENVFSWDLKRGIRSELRGIRTTPQTKVKGCNTLKDLIEKNKMIIRDKQTIQQLYTFISRGNTWKADSGNKDDLVMSLVIGSFFFSLPEYREYLQNPNSFRSEIINDEINFINNEMASLWGHEFTDNSFSTQLRKNRDVTISIDVTLKHFYDDVKENDRICFSD